MSADWLVEEESAIPRAANVYAVNRKTVFLLELPDGFLGTASVYSVNLPGIITPLGQLFLYLCYGLAVRAPAVGRGLYRLNARD